MAVLLLRLAGPLQSWGTQSRFTERDTGREPSKSGVIGLLCDALGRERPESVADLAALKMIVRVDNEGIIQKDYHTAQNILLAKGTGTKPCELSNRYYLSDADFLVALSGDGVLLEQIHKALQKPHWQTFLGRKSFVPSVPIYISNGLKLDCDDALSELQKYQWPRPDITVLPKNYEKMLKDSQATSVSLCFVIETAFGQGPQVVCDQPVGAAFETRQFTIRHTETKYYEIPVTMKEADVCSSPV